MTYPRILIAALVRVNAADSSNNGLLLRSLLGEWPRENLAQVFSDGSNGDEGFFGRYYKLGPRDRRWGNIFYRMKTKAREANPTAPTVAVRSDIAGRIRSLSRRFMMWLFLDTGLYELLFRPGISREMRNWVSEFKPDVILAQGYNFTFSWLPVMLQKETGARVIFLTTDDWPAYTYSVHFVRRMLGRAARRLIQAAAVRIAFGEKMRREYETRYNARFFPAYHLDSLERFPRDTAALRGSIHSIAFVGSLYWKRHEAIRDLLSVVRSAAAQGTPLSIHVYSSGIPEEISDDMRSAPEISFLPLPAHEELPAVLAREGILFLAESFSADPGAISLSLSTKCHLFMASGRPILAYGPAYSGSIDYASREGWAAVVTERNSEQLLQALVRLQHDQEYRTKLAVRASEVFLKNHDLHTGRLLFQQWVTAAARSARSVPSQQLVES